jgi:hypothetical protein
LFQDSEDWFDSRFSPRVGSLPGRTSQLARILQWAGAQALPWQLTPRFKARAKFESGTYPSMLCCSIYCRLVVEKNPLSVST